VAGNWLKNWKLSKVKLPHIFNGFKLPWKWKGTKLVCMRLNTKEVRLDCWRERERQREIHILHKSMNNYAIEKLQNVNIYMPANQGVQSLPTLAHVFLSEKWYSISLCMEALYVYWSFKTLNRFSHCLVHKSLKGATTIQSCRTKLYYYLIS
jgi:hypothetical protein